MNKNCSNVTRVGETVQTNQSGFGKTRIIVKQNNKYYGCDLTEEHPQMLQELERQENIKEDQYMDCSVNSRETSVAEQKLSIRNFHFKSQTPEVLMPSSDDQNSHTENIKEDQYMDCSVNFHFKSPNQQVLIPISDDQNSHTVDINVSQAKKRLERNPGIAGAGHAFQTEQHPQPRKSDKDQIKIYNVRENIVDKLRALKAGRSVEKFFHTFDSKKFSGPDNLKVFLYAVSAGSFGTVYKAEDHLTKQKMVVKKIKKTCLKDFEENEVMVPASHSDAKNLAQIFGVIWTGKKLLIVMEDAGLSLSHLIHKEPEILANTSTIEEIMLNTFSGISDLGKHGNKHCDIKPENLCHNLETSVTKLVDFGSCLTKIDSEDSKGKTMCRRITPEYLDPTANKDLLYYMTESQAGRQVRFPHRFDQKDDVYAAGLVGLYILKKEHPMVSYLTKFMDYPRGPNISQQKRQEAMKLLSELTQEQMNEIMDVQMSDTMKELLQGVLNLNRSLRWNADTAVSFLKRRLDDIQQPSWKRSKFSPKKATKNSSLGKRTYASVKVQKTEKQNPFPEVAHSSTYQIDNPGQRMGFPLKGNLESNHIRGALIASNLSVSMRQEDRSLMSDVPLSGDTAVLYQHYGQQPFAGAQPQSHSVKGETFIPVEVTGSLKNQPLQAVTVNNMQSSSVMGVFPQIRAAQTVPCLKSSKYNVTQLCAPDQTVVNPLPGQHGTHLSASGWNFVNQTLSGQNCPQLIASGQEITPLRVSAQNAVNPILSNHDVNQFIPTAQNAVNPTSASQNACLGLSGKIVELENLKSGRKPASSRKTVYPGPCGQLLSSEPSGQVVANSRLSVHAAAVSTSPGQLADSRPFDPAIADSRSFSLSPGHSSSFSRSPGLAVSDSMSCKTAREAFTPYGPSGQVIVDPGTPIQAVAYSGSLDQAVTNCGPSGQATIYPETPVQAVAYSRSLGQIVTYHGSTGQATVDPGISEQAVVNSRSLGRAFTNYGPSGQAIIDPGSAARIEQHSAVAQSQFLQSVVEDSPSFTELLDLPLISDHLHGNIPDFNLIGPSENWDL